MTPSQKKQQSAFSAALPHCSPVMVGYLFCGFAMGLLAQRAGYPWWIVMMLSLLMYAGAMQFLAVELFVAGTSFVQIAIITLFVQSRHAFYGLSLLDRYQKHWRFKPYMIFSLTDEAYALHISSPPPPPGISCQSYDLAVATMLHASWFTGTMLGVICGGFIRLPLEGLDFALTALFVSTCVEQWKSARTHIPAIGSMVVSVGMLLLFGADRFMLPALAALVVMLFAFRPVIEKKIAPDDPAANDSNREEVSPCERR
jgi:Predicted branched-chain amino acid permease (azaleucine resistance)